MAKELEPPWAGQGNTGGTSPTAYTSPGSIAGTVFQSGSGLSDPDAVAGNSTSFSGAQSNDGADVFSDDGAIWRFDNPAQIDAWLDMLEQFIRGNVAEDEDGRFRAI